MVCKIEPPHKCYTIWHHKCTLEVTMRLGMLDEATSEILAARVNQNKIWKLVMELIKKPS